MNLYTLARTWNTLSSLARPWPRLKNILLGRTLARMGFWRWLWK